MCIFIYIHTHSCIRILSYFKHQSHVASCRRRDRPLSDLGDTYMLKAGTQWGTRRSSDAICICVYLYIYKHMHAYVYYNMFNTNPTLLLTGGTVTHSAIWAISPCKRLVHSGGRRGAPPQVTTWSNRCLEPSGKGMYIYIHLYVYIHA